MASSGQNHDGPFLVLCGILYVNQKRCQQLILVPKWLTAFAACCMVLAVSMRGYEMNPRKKSAVVQLKVRLKEPLRARIEKAARKQQHPMNTEIVDRLEVSFLEDEKLQLTYQLVMDGVYEQFGEKGTYYLMKLLAQAMAISEDETGKSWRDDADTCSLVEDVFNSILSRYGPESVRLSKPAESQQSEGIAGALVGGLEGTRTRAQLEKDRNRKLED